MSIDFEDWDVDLKKLSATHSCGFTLTIEGSVRNPSVVHPGPFPKHLSALDQVRLLRHGVEAISKAGKEDSSFRDAPSNRRYDRSNSSPKVVKKPSTAIKSNRAKKPILSLKKKSSEKQPAEE